MYVDRVTSVCASVFLRQIAIYHFPPILPHRLVSGEKKTKHLYCCSYYKIPQLDIIAMQIWDACLCKCNLICLFRLSLCSLWGQCDREGGRQKREGWHKRPQTPQMGFQSVLIYSSPSGLLSVVICLRLGWHHPCPSWFRLRVPSMQGNP